ncbi:hypothetical protein V491_02292, partial [Pseudogymnoascus sp. VKM F-3775]
IRTARKTEVLSCRTTMYKGHQERAHSPLRLLLKERHSDIRQGTHIVLDPQPSNDPNDPLNWPLWKRDAVFGVIFINTILLAAVPPPLLASSLTVLADIFNRPLSDMTQLSGYLVLVAGVLGPIVSALARKYGKRPQFIFSAIMGIIGTSVCIGSGDSYKILLAGRLIQGLGTTAFESLSLAVLGDLFFVHERGSRTGILVLCLTCMSSVVSIVSGPITERLGWKYMFIIHLPFVAAGAIAVLFYLPETQFRSALPEQRTVEEMLSGSLKGPIVEHNQTVSNDAVLEETQAYHKKTYVQSLAIFNGTYSSSFFKLLLAPFVMILNPAVLWSILVGGIPVGFYGTLAYILAQIWSGPPYNLSAAGNGYFYIGGLLGGLIGGVGGAKLCDMSSIWLVKRNRGTYEAEFRIPIQILGALLLGLGFFVFMWDVNHPTTHGYYLGAVCHGFICAGVTVTSTSSSLYIIDAYRAHATEIFILSMTVKNLMFYGFSYFMNDWATQDGAGAVFKVYGIVSLCFLATNIPMYVLGKVNRKFVHGLVILHKFAGL